jgi:hypothetical protein
MSHDVSKRYEGSHRSEPSEKGFLKPMVDDNESLAETRCTTSLDNGAKIGTSQDWAELTFSLWWPMRWTMALPRSAGACSSYWLEAGISPIAFRYLALLAKSTEQVEDG